MNKIYDIPHILLTICITIQSTTCVRDIDKKFRKFVFPNEAGNSRYKYYSYNACVTECLKDYQLLRCNCTHFNMIYDGLYPIK